MAKTHTTINYKIELERTNKLKQTLVLKIIYINNEATLESND